MSVLSEPRAGAANCVAIASNPASLSAFMRPGCAAAIWRRQLQPDVLSWVSALDPDCLPRGRMILRPDAVAETVRTLCDNAQTPPGPGRDLLESDIPALGEAFSDLMGARFLRLRLDVVTTNACRKFHVDAIHARLVCTYRGTGTQYGISQGGLDPRRVFTVPTGAPILLRGSLWPATPPSGLRHRSPPIEGTSETRLVLVLDPVFDPKEGA